MTNITRQGDSDQYNVISVAVDTREEMINFSTDFAQGSTGFVIDDSSAWMLKGEPKRWKELE